MLPAKVAIDSCTAPSIPQSSSLHVVKLQPSVILSVVAQFWTDISHFDTLANFKSFGVSELYYKRQYTVLAAINDKLGKEDTVSTVMTKVAWPPFGGSLVRRVYDELVCFLIKCRSCFKSLNV